MRSNPIFSHNALCATPRDYEFWASFSVALGHLWLMKETNIHFVESEIVWALEWIRTDWSDQRLAATLTLTLNALALYAPTAFHSKTNVSTGSNEFLDHIYIRPVLSNIQPTVRVCATDALSQCFTMLQNSPQSKPARSDSTLMPSVLLYNGRIEPKTRNKPQKTITYLNDPKWKLNVMDLCKW